MICQWSSFPLSSERISKTLRNSSSFRCRSAQACLQFGEAPSLVDVSRVSEGTMAGTSGFKMSRQPVGPSLASHPHWRNMYFEIADSGTNSEAAVVETSGGIKLNFLEEATEAAGLFKSRTEEIRQAIVSADYEVKPTPYTPTEGTEALQFYVTCAGLVVAFWVGNYFVPDLIFKNTVFAEEEVDEFQNAVENARGENEQFGGSQQVSQEVEDLSVQIVDGEKPANDKVGLGFGKTREQTAKKTRS